MKKLTSILGITLLVASLSVPVFAWAHGWEKGYHNKGYWKGCPGYGAESDRGYGNLSEKQREQLDNLKRKFSEETAQMRDKIWSKSEELYTLLNATNPDAEKVKALQKEISELKSQFAQARINYELESRKIDPDARFKRGYGRGGRYGHHMGGSHMMDYGRHMGGYGRHMGGYGPGGCWN